MLARCTRDAIDLAASLSAAGADLAVIQENVNTRSPMGQFVFILFSALAELEREQVAERTSAAMLRHQAKGRRMTRPDRCPYGGPTRPILSDSSRTPRSRRPSPGFGTNAGTVGDFARLHGGSTWPALPVAPATGRTRPSAPCYSDRRNSPRARDPRLRSSRRRLPAVKRGVSPPICR
jgi:hypothetical protein